MNTNQEKQKFFKELVTNGLLIVSKDGTIFNTKTDRNIVIQGRIIIKVFHICIPKLGHI